MFNLNLKSARLGLLLLSGILFGSLNVFSKPAAPLEISGTISLSSDLSKLDTSKGVVFVLGKKVGVEAGPPLAVMRIPNPQFPVKFKITRENLMIPGTSFDGNMVITARFSPSGDAMDKSGPEGKSKGEVKMGDKEVKIELKPKG